MYSVPEVNRRIYTTKKRCKLGKWCQLVCTEIRYAFQHELNMIKYIDN